MNSANRNFGMILVHVPHKKLVICAEQNYENIVKIFRTNEQYKKNILAATRILRIYVQGKKKIVAAAKVLVAKCT